MTSTMKMAESQTNQADSPDGQGGSDASYSNDELTRMLAAFTVGEAEPNGSDVVEDDAALADSLLMQQGNSGIPDPHIPAHNPPRPSMDSIAIRTSNAPAQKPATRPAARRAVVIPGVQPKSAEAEPALEDSQKLNQYDTTADDSSVQEIQPEAVDAELETKRKLRLRNLISEARQTLNEEASESDSMAIEASRFNIKWEKALRQSKKNTDKLCDVITDLGALEDGRSVRMLTSFAHAKQKRVRFATAKALRNIGTPDALNVLLSLLKDPKPEVARAAMIGLVRSANGTTLPPILAYGVTNPSARAGVLRELTRIESPDSVREQLFELAHNDGDELGIIALQGAGRLSDSDSISRIAPFVKHHSPEFRKASLEALIRTKNQQVVRFLNQALNDEDEDVRSVAASGLSQWGSSNTSDRLLKLLRDPSADVRRNAAKSLKDKMKPESAKHVIPVLQKEDDVGILVLLLEALGRSGAKEVSRYIYPFTRRPEHEVRITALSALTKLKDKRAQPALLRLLDDEDPQIRQKAADGVAIKGNKAAIQKLESLLKDDRDVTVRSAAARALGAIGNSAAQPALAQAMYDESTVRCQSVVALKRIGNKSAIPILLERLRDSAPEVRYNAVKALGEFEAKKESEDALRDMIEDPDEMVQRAVHKTLKGFGISISSDLMKRRADNVARKVRSVLPDWKIVVGSLLVVCLGAGGWFGRKALGLTFEKPMLVLEVTDAAISPDGEHVVLLRARGVMDLWSAKTGKLVTRYAPETVPNGILFPVDSNVVHLLGNGSDQVWDLNADSRPQPGSFNFDGLQRVLVSNHDRSAVITASGANGAMPFLWDGERKVTNVKLHPQFNLARTLSPDGTTLGAVNQFNEIGLFALATGEKTASIKLSLADRPGTVTALGYSPDAKKMALGFSYGEVSILDLTTGELNTLKDKGTRVTQLHWMPGQLIAVHASEVTFLPDEGDPETIDISLTNIDRVSVAANSESMLLGDTEARDVIIVDIGTKQVRWTLEGVSEQ